MRKFSTSRAEWKYIEKLLEEVDALGESRIKEMVENVLVWYVVKAKQYKLVEFILNSITVISPTIILILNQCVKDIMCGQVAVSFVGTLAASAKSFSKIHDKRISYRNAAEKIKIETFCRGLV